MKKYLFICPNCKTTTIIQGKYELSENYTPLCASCSGRTINMTSDEYKYGQLA